MGGGVGEGLYQPRQTVLGFSTVRREPNWLLAAMRNEGWQKANQGPNFKDALSKSAISSYS